MKQQLYIQVVYTNYSGQMMDNYLPLVPGLVGCMYAISLCGYNMFVSTARFQKLAHGL